MLRWTACAAAFLSLCPLAHASEPAHPAELDDMIVRQAKRHGVPEKLVRRIVMRESRYNPRARNHSFWGLMQISYPTARSMGFKGTPSDLLDPLVNLTYAVPYLANAFIIAGRQEDAAVRLYASGYYATAKNRNLLGQLRTAESAPLVPGEDFLTATARPVSNLITAVINGPPERQLPGETGPAATLAPAVAASADAISAGAPFAVASAGEAGGVKGEAEITMVSSRGGYVPPPKWVRDGGVSLVARGEQRIDQVAAYNPPAEAGSSGRRTATAHGKSRKNTQFASLDAPPPGAQAYAAGIPSPDSGPQAAIAQATSNPAGDVPPTAEEPTRMPSAKPDRYRAAHPRKVIAKKAPDGAAPASSPNVASEVNVASAPEATQPAAKKPAVKKVRVAAAKKTLQAASAADKAAEPQAGPEALR